MDKLVAMQTFVQVADCGSFTRAADVLQLPKASVTQRINALEAELRVRLLERTTRSMRLTDDGRMYYERSVRLLAEIDDLERSLHSLDAQPRGIVRVDMLSALARLAVVPALPAFMARYPEIALRIGSSDRAVDLIEDGIDCVIRAGALADSSLIARPICVVQMGLYAAPAYLRRRGMPKQPEELVAHDCIGIFNARTAQALPWTLIQDGKGNPGQPRLECNDVETGIAACLAGLGIAMAPPFVVTDYLQSGALRPVLPAHCAARIPLQIAYVSNRYLPTRTRCFIDWVLALLANHPTLASTPNEMAEKYGK